MYGLIALNFIIPFVMVFVGYILKKHPVKDMTSGLVEIVLCISLLLLNISTQTTVFAGVVVGIIFLIFGFYKTETGITSKFANKNF